MPRTPSTRPGRRLRLALAACLVVSGLSACTQDPVSAAVGSVLADVRDDVNSMLAQAATQGNVLGVTTAGQLDLVVSNAESAFADDLAEGIDQVDDATRRAVNQVQDLVASVDASVATTLESAIVGSQQLINSLPFANRNPQVRAYSPEYVTRRQETVRVAVTGNFFWAMERKKEVTLHHGERTYSPTESTTGRVSFEIPVADLPTAGDGFARASLRLVAPYEKGKVFKETVPGTFNLLVTVLPQSPVKRLQVTNARQVTGLEVKDQTAPAEFAQGGSGWRVQSWSSCDVRRDSHAISASAGGWRIVPSSVQVHYVARGFAPRGRASVTTVSPTGFVVEGSTEPSCFLGISNDSGDITYYVSYREERDFVSATSETVDLLAAPSAGLDWGDQLTVPVARGAWRLEVTLWDGTQLQTSATDSSNQFVKVSDQGDHVLVRLEAPGRSSLS